MKYVCMIWILIAAILLGVMPVENASAASEWGEIRKATRNLNVRQKRHHTSKLVLTLNKGDQVKVDFLENGWYAIFSVDETDRNITKALGYSKATYLAFVSKPEGVEPETPMTEEKPEAPVEAPAAKPSASDEAVAQIPAPDTFGQKVTASVEQRPEDITVKPGDGKPPVKITADKLTYNDSQRTVAFLGNVYAEHDDLKLFADSLTAYLAKQGAPGEEVDRIVAKGKVRMERGSTNGRCNMITYYVKSGEVRMEGQPILEDGQNTVTGKVIKYFTKDNRSEVVGGKNQRVEAIFFTPNAPEAP